MPVPDTFPYTARWDSVGLSCGVCLHFRGPEHWPDVARTSRCALHELPLIVQLAPSGYMEGEWFCRDFEDNGRAHPPAVQHFRAIRESLQGGVLYQFYCPGGNLGERSFEELRRPAP